MSDLVLARKVYFCCAYEDDRLQGHNYCLEAFFAGPLNAKSGLVVNLSDIDPLLKEVVEELDHKHLNHDVEFFKALPPKEVGLKSLLQFCGEKLQLLLPPDCPARLVQLRLTQGEDLSADLRLDSGADF